MMVYRENLTCEWLSHNVKLKLSVCSLAIAYDFI
jgi:hypothetical protein